MKYKKPNPGETVHCWANGKKYIAHKHMLFLGKDKVAEDRLLVPCKKYGWNIISLSDLPEGRYRPLGKFNLVKETVNKRKKTTLYTYRFFDKRKPVDITVKIVKGEWRLKADFETPSWVEKEEEDARGTGSKENS